MEDRDFKFCMCVYNGVDQRSCNGHLPILGSFREKCQKVQFYVKIHWKLGTCRFENYWSYEKYLSDIKVRHMS